MPIELFKWSLAPNHVLSLKGNNRHRGHQATADNWLALEKSEDTQPAKSSKQQPIFLAQTRAHYSQHHATDAASPGAGAIGSPTF